MAFDPVKLAEDTEAFCQEVRPAEELAYAERKFNDQVVPLAKKYNLLGMNVHPEYGGRGADAVNYFKALARIGREGTTVRTFFSGHLSIGAYPIQTWGSERLKQKYLPAASRGDKVLAFGLTEPDAGSNPREMTTTYTKKGDGYVLNGVKYLISNGGIAHAVIAFGYPEGEVGTGRISAFVVDTDAKGFEAESFAVNAKMGMPTSNTAMFEMHDVAVPAENLLGTEGDGFRIALGTLVSGRLSVAAGCLGVIEDCLAEAIEYSKMRKQHGKEIARHQLVQDHIAHIEMDRVASESMVLRAAEMKDRSAAEPGDKELLRQADLLAAQAKFFTTNAAWDAADRAVQVFGGRGWSTLYRPGRHLTDVRVCRIYEGTDEILKLKIAASVLGKEWEAFK
ncbi:acyl- dehydrogenase : Putative acyl-CoA dehydrogenase OS=Nitrososphaera gargensis (strain Ga9.2) GN=Ngar_c13350 PE=3 SV=1: Acyl-CoA_dh_N: Acyl-CoA_dh_M: Acyl-CoA_dh_1 [Gemmata massiliana]|uniref:Acyl-CoA dehydrogenase/oxidase C-terminal domain-containing protein n=1 Tax=Gemmata massiliana TaxID=1210884 RepID=A0A6P2CW24_9BACT|nr:acyl-CoA dehydrogenase family protein [Gemmata massiliana]VTR92365.1 acyl- dehydrogenase : Putative acyl-CoA dehydrogenase OS=Nitrososphaera gargensis (strain Ga9.2) GN=Ngar_c13350 PE=3 SV=1: Acyl-CoA_dh_N: Acyl-CoA_dh_M: Acyl-CoA_dh_1 [Gemmata massiliana]